MVRIKNRYVVVQLMPSIKTKVLHMKHITLARCILYNVRKYYGIYGLGRLEQGFRVKYCNEHTKVAIIRCSHGAHQYITSILPLITLVGEIRAKFRTLYMGATIMQCNKFIVRHQIQALDRLIGQFPSAKERQDLIRNVMEFELEN